jgi:hypothetical protein
MQVQLCIANDGQQPATPAATLSPSWSNHNHCVQICCHCCGMMPQHRWHGGGHKLVLQPPQASESLSTERMRSVLRTAATMASYNTCGHKTGQTNRPTDNCQTNTPTANLLSRPSTTNFQLQCIACLAACDLSQAAAPSPCHKTAIQACPCLPCHPKHHGAMTLVQD